MRSSAPSWIRSTAIAIASFVVCWLATSHVRQRLSPANSALSEDATAEPILPRSESAESAAPRTDWRTFFADYATASAERRRELKADAARESDLTQRTRGFDEWMRLNSGLPWSDSRSAWLNGLKQKAAALVEDKPAEAYQLMIDAMRTSDWDRWSVTSYLGRAENDIHLARLLAMHPDLIHASSENYYLIDSAVACLAKHDEWTLAESLFERLPTVLEQEWARWRIDVARLRKHDPDPLRILDRIPTDYRRYKAFQAWVLSEARPDASTMKAALGLFTSPEWKQKADSLMNSLPPK